MTEESGRTLVCSVLFIDIIAYSKKAVSEQYDMKRQFNGMLAGALEVLKRRDRVIVDTGDGAAVIFLGDPEDALVVGVGMREHADRMPMRMGINLGPVKLINDLNDQVNVIGDGINAAQRVMSFAEPGQLLASASYKEVVSRQAVEYENLFRREGTRQDKHVRDHELYSISEDLRMGGGESLLEEAMPELLATGVFRAPEKHPAELPAPVREPAKVLDAGQKLMISGANRASVNEALERLFNQGATLISPISYVGNTWIAACTHPHAPAEVKVEEFGLTRIVSGPSREAVSDKAAEFVSFGGKLRGEIELIDGIWTAVCDV